MADVFERLISKFRVNHTGFNLSFPWSVGEHSHLVLITLAFPIPRLAYKPLLGEVNPGERGASEQSLLDLETFPAMRPPCHERRRINDLDQEKAGQQFLSGGMG